MALTPTPSDANLQTSDITTGNVSTSRHGFAPKVPNDATKYLDGTGAYSVPAGSGGGGGAGLNYLINGDQSSWSRQLTATTLTAPSYKGATITTSADGYSSDQWKVATQSATVPNAQQVDTNGAQESGLSARYYGNLKALATCKMVWYQPLEAAVTYGLDGKTMTLQVLLKASSSKTMRLGVIQLNSSGTMDTIPAALVPTTWGSNSTDPTLGTNLAYITPASVPSGAQGSVSGSAVSCSVTTSWQTFALTFAVPATGKNLILALWTDSQFSNADIISASQWMLTVGSTLQTWAPPDVQQEQSRCYRHSYRYQFGGLVNTAFPASPNGASASMFALRTTVPMRGTPTFSYSANADFKIAITGVGTNAFTGTPAMSAPTSTNKADFFFDVATSGSLNQPGAGWLQPQSTSAWMLLDSAL